MGLHWLKTWPAMSETILMSYAAARFLAFCPDKSFIALTRFESWCAVLAELFQLPISRGDSALI